VKYHMKLLKEFFVYFLCDIRHFDYPSFIGSFTYIFYLMRMDYANNVVELSTVSLV
jgi:hypothetical protein